MSRFKAAPFEYEPVFSSAEPAESSITSADAPSAASGAWLTMTSSIGAIARLGSSPAPAPPPDPIGAGGGAGSGTTETQTKGTGMGSTRSSWTTSGSSSAEVADESERLPCAVTGTVSGAVFTARSAGFAGCSSIGRSPLEAEGSPWGGRTAAVIIESKLVCGCADGWPWDSTSAGVPEGAGMRLRFSILGWDNFS